ncbi:uncharacterized protein CLAFUR5_02397 [Fulvia fulva]|uniref:N-acetyltransferase domain-containing protein n=1 Tax=Passalora fulva TaxID=5499 RepID=A0A9Q8LAJ2_PASFU|nr:uncharacterized protein CLAFUR5_02397 [Fulvia fulva]UJO13193.1 hypothetical protein CLAFUR5_02397 [Fulvia fulva]
MEQNNALPNVLHTERLVLRFADPNSESDCSKILHVLHGNGMTAATLGNIKDVHTRHKDFAPKSGWCAKAPVSDRQFHLIYRKSKSTESGSEEVLGWITMNFRPEMACPDIGYILLPQHCGHGYATEAARAVLQFWREEVGVREVFAAIAEGDAKSVKIAESLGMVRGGGLWLASGHDDTKTRAMAYVLPGMKWREVDVDGEGMEWVVKPAFNTGEKVEVGGVEGR